jgi:hypothetical protein
MKLSEVKKQLKNLEEIAFELPDGTLVPRHFHVTEVGKINKDFIDCGGTVRNEKVVNFQLWEANDYDHRLHPEKLLKIIELSETTLGIEDWEVEVEYQGNTIGKYALGFSEGHFLLRSTLTDCLAKDKCGIPEEKLKVELSQLQKNDSSSCCEPGSSCC